VRGLIGMGPNFSDSRHIYNIELTLHTRHIKVCGIKVVVLLNVATKLYF